MRRRVQLVIAIAITSIMGFQVNGQGFRRGGPGGRGGSPRLATSGLKVGSPMPEVTVFAADGAEFDTASLKGNYSVVVFGCLT